MTLRLLPNRTSALRAERLEVLRFCSDLSREEWSAPSTAQPTQTFSPRAALRWGKNLSAVLLDLAGDLV